MSKISIIIPVFNTQNHIKKCLESCLEQSFSDFEIIIIDDKSTDLSLKIAESFCDKRIKIIRNPKNLGTFLARLEGIKAANSEYILFLDSDDYLRSDALDLLFSAIEAQNADMIHFGIINEPPKKYATLPKIHTKTLLKEEIAHEIIIRHFRTSWLTLCGRMYKTSLVKNAANKLDFIDKHLISSEDTIMFFVILLLAQKSIGISENLYIYCENVDSISRTRDDARLLKQIDDRTYLKSALKRLANDKDLSAHKYFHSATRRILDMLEYFICFSKKFLKTKSAIILPYVKYSLLSMKFMPRYQTMIKLLIFFATLGKKRL